MPVPAGPDPSTASALFTLEELASYLQQDLHTSSATIARRVASGWLQAATGVTEWTTVSDSLFGWSLELAAIAFPNPDNAPSESTDDHSVTYDRARRAEILKAAASALGSGGRPQHSFPEPDWH